MVFMPRLLSRERFKTFKRIVSIFILIPFVTTYPIQSYAQVLQLPAPGVVIPPSLAFEPAVIKGITINPQNPLQFDFLIDQGETKLQDAEQKAEFERLIKYFMASLTIPEKEQWVNLSPLEKDRIIADSFGKTEMGRDMLA